MVPSQPDVEPYRPHPQAIPAPEIPIPASRVAHGTALKGQMEEVAAQALARRENLPVQVHGAAPGVYVVFESQPNVQLVLESLESSRQGIEVVSVTSYRTNETVPMGSTPT